MDRNGRNQTSFIIGRGARAVQLPAFQQQHFRAKRTRPIARSHPRSPRDVSRRTPPTVDSQADDFIHCCHGFSPSVVLEASWQIAGLARSTLLPELLKVMQVRLRGMLGARSKSTREPETRMKVRGDRARGRVAHRRRQCAAPGGTADCHAIQGGVGRPRRLSWPDLRRGRTPSRDSVSAESGHDSPVPICRVLAVCT